MGQPVLLINSLHIYIIKKILLIFLWISTKSKLNSSIYSDWYIFDFYHQIIWGIHFVFIYLYNGSIWRADISWWAKTCVNLVCQLRLLIKNPDDAGPSQQHV